MSLTASMLSPARNCFTASSSGFCIGPQDMLNKKPSCCNFFELLFGEIGSMNLIDQQYNTKTTGSNETEWSQARSRHDLFFLSLGCLALDCPPFCSFAPSWIVKVGLSLLLEGSAAVVESCQESEHQRTQNYQKKTHGFRVVTCLHLESLSMQLQDASQLLSDSLNPLTLLFPSPMLLSSP